MSARTLVAGSLAIPVSATRYLDLYLQDTDRLNLLVHIQYNGVAGTGVTVNLFDGVGKTAGRDPAITYPYNQSVPHVFGDGTTLTTVVFEALGQSMTLSTVNGTTFDQSGSIAVDRKKGQTYLRIKLSNADGANGATADVYATVA